LGGLDVVALVDRLDSPNGWVRDKAQMLLHWRNDRAAVPALERLARDGGRPLGRMHALHTLDYFGALTDDVLVAAFEDREPGVRIHALVLAEKRTASRVVADATQLVGDPDARVRLQLALSIGAWNQAGAGRALAALAARDGGDSILRGAVASSLVAHLAIFATTFQGHDELLDATFRTALGEKRDDVMLALLEPPLTRATVGDAASLGRARSALLLLRGQKLTLESLAAKHGDDARWTGLVARKNELFASIRRTLPSLPLAQQAFLATLLLGDPAEDSAAVELLGRLLAPRSGLQPLGDYVGQLARLADPRVPDILLREWEQRTPGERSVILDALMGREAWVPDLLGRVEAGKIAAGSFDAQRQARLLKHPNAAIRRKASSVFSATASRSRAQVLDAFRPALAASGDRAKGKAVFAQACAACHQLEGAGLPLGPDLRSVVEHPAEKLLISILDPNADIQPGFAAYFCELNSGEQLYGSIASETGGSLAFRLADGTTRAIVRSDIKSLQSSNVSLMPEGLEASLTPQSLADLIAYLKAAK
jgi:putative heme-binding domain-containing protein